MVHLGSTFPHEHIDCQSQDVLFKISGAETYYVHNAKIGVNYVTLQNIMYTKISADYVVIVLGVPLCPKQLIVSRISA